jgi:hypothetical protein
MEGARKVISMMLRTIKLDYHLFMIIQKLLTTLRISEEDAKMEKDP